MYVVAGATGNTGSAAASRLLEAGRKVRVIVRDAPKGKAWAARGAEVAIADLGNPAALETALGGAEGVYLLSPPDLATQDFLNERRKLFAGVAKAVQGAGVPHVVFLSSIGAQQASGTGPVLSVRDAERALEGTGAATTFVRAAYFMENWGAVLQVARSDGVLPSFIPRSLVMPMVAARDIGAAAARALLDGPRGRRVIELGGPADISPDGVADVLTRMLGRQVAVSEAPLDAVVPTFASFGVSANVAGLYRDMYQAIRDGRLTWQDGGTERARGTTSIEDALRPLLGPA